MNLAPYVVARNIARAQGDATLAAAPLPDEFGAYAEMIASFEEQRPELFTPHFLPAQRVQKLPAGLFALDGAYAQQLSAELRNKPEMEVVPDNFVAIVKLRENLFLMFPEDTKRAVLSFFLPQNSPLDGPIGLGSVTYDLSSGKEGVREIPSYSDSTCVMGLWGKDELLVCEDKGCKKNGSTCRQKKGYKGRAIITRCRCA